MARVSVEECWWSDPRRMALILKIGLAADAVALNMWRSAQEFWGKGRGLIPKEVFDKLPHAADLIECGLANVRDASVYVRGSSEYLEWHYEKRAQARENGKKGGQSSVKKRREKYGSAVPKGASNSNQNRSDSEAESSEPKLSGSLSNSLSDSGLGVVGEKAPAAAPATTALHPTRRQDLSMHPDVEKFEVTLGDLGKSVQRSLKAFIPEIIHHFITHEDFLNWARGMVNSRTAKKIGTDIQSRERYAIMAIKHEIGLVAESPPASKQKVSGDPAFRGVVPD